MDSSANIPDDMSDSAIAHIVLEQMQDFRKEIRQDMRDLKADLKADIDDVKTDVGEVKSDVAGIKDDLSEVKGDVANVKSYVQDQLAGKNGMNDRITRLESQVSKSRNGNSDSSSPDASRTSKKTVSKENLVAGATGVGAGGILYIVLEIAKSLLVK